MENLEAESISGRNEWVISTFLSTVAYDYDHKILILKTEHHAKILNNKYLLMNNNNL